MIPQVSQSRSHHSLDKHSTSHHNRDKPLASHHDKKLSLDHFPVASARNYPTGPSSPSYQSVRGISTHRSSQFRNSGVSRDALLASASCDNNADAPDQWASADDFLSASYKPKYSQQNLRTDCSYQKPSSPSSKRDAHSSPSMTSLSHNNLQGVSFHNISTLSQSSAYLPAKNSVPYQLAPIVGSSEYRPPNKAELLETETRKESNTRWKWLSFLVLSLLALSILVGSAIAYDRFLKQSIDSSPPLHQPLSSR